MPTWLLTCALGTVPFLHTNRRIKQLVHGSVMGLQCPRVCKKGTVPKAQVSSHVGIMRVIAGHMR
ncbi:hypothetical protein, partial [Paratractidigestivibacter sp.]|uniref:hypothetical protein n=1 Tax=Paratractidigestivibacter sp. TaxID=2847316 RepID=UPI002ABDAB3C